MAGAAVLFICSMMNTPFSPVNTGLRFPVFSPNPLPNAAGSRPALVKKPLAKLISLALSTKAPAPYFFATSSNVAPVAAFSFSEIFTAFNSLRTLSVNWSLKSSAFGLSFEVLPVKAATTYCSSVSKTVEVWSFLVSLLKAQRTISRAFCKVFTFEALSGRREAVAIANPSFLACATKPSFDFTF